MARARNIKPGFFRNSDLVELSFETRLLFIGLWTLADRAGRMEDRPKQIKMEIFPADSVDVGAGLDELASIGVIRRYVAGGMKLIQVTNFSKHQAPHHAEKPSSFPCEETENQINPAANQANPGQALGEPRATTGPIVLIPDSLIPDSLIPDSLIPDSLIPEPTPSAAGEGDFEEAWAAYPSRPGKSKADALKAWTARIKSGVDPGVMVAGVARYAAYCKALGTEPQFIKQPATFFGPGEHYQSEWAAPKTKPDTSRHSGFDSKNYREGIAEDGSF